MVVGEGLSAAVGTLRRRQAVLVPATALAVWYLVLLVAAGALLSTLTVPDGPVASLLIGLGAAGRASHVAIAAINYAVAVAVVVLVVDVGGTLGSGIATAVTDALLRDEAASTRSALASVDVDATAGRSAAYLVGVWVLTLAALPVTLALYLVVGTGLEALGYALGLYEFLPRIVPILGVGLVVPLLARWLAASALTCAPLVTDGRGRRAALRASLRYAVANPRTALARGGVVGALTLAPFVVPGLLVVTLGRGPTALLAAAPAVLLVAPFAFALRACYRIDAVERGAGAAVDRYRAGPSVRRLLPAGRTVAAILVVCALVAGGTVVRVDDVRPGSREAAAPGPVAPGDDPGAVLSDARDAIERSSHAVTYRKYTGTTNGTPVEWTPTFRTEFRYDRPDRRVRSYASFVDAREATPTWDTHNTYVGETLFAQGSVSYSAATPRPHRFDGVPRAWEGGARLLTFPGGGWLGLGTPNSRAANALEDAGDHSWEVVEVNDSRIVYESRDPAAVAGSTGSAPDADKIESGSVRVHVDRETGYVRRISRTFRASYSSPGEVHRTVITVEGYGSTDVPRPDPVESRSITEFLLDAMFY